MVFYILQMPRRIWVCVGSDRTRITMDSSGPVYDLRYTPDPITHLTSWRYICKFSQSYASFYHINHLTPNRWAIRFWNYIYYPWYVPWNRTKHDCHRNLNQSVLCLCKFLGSGEMSVEPPSLTSRSCSIEPNLNRCGSWIWIRWILRVRYKILDPYPTPNTPTPEWYICKSS